MQVTVVGQLLPVQMSIRMQLTSMHISFRPRSIDFGQCNLGENTGVAVQVTNHSSLPQKYGELSELGPLLFTQTCLCIATPHQIFKYRQYIVCKLALAWIKTDFVLLMTQCLTYLSSRWMLSTSDTVNSNLCMPSLVYPQQFGLSIDVSASG